jgi:hypothetical protein
MKVRWERVFTDDELIKLHAKLKPSNRVNSRKAKREDVRGWLDTLVKDALSILPPARVRLTVDPNRRAGEVSDGSDNGHWSDKGAFSVPATEHKAFGDDIIGGGGAADPLLTVPCKCGAEKADHYGRLLQCPLRKGVKPGARYTPAETR